VRELVVQAADWLAEKGVPSPRLDADRLLAHALGLRRLDLYLDLDRPLEPDEVARFRELVRRRGRREPLAYVLGSWSFRGLELATDARALVPRP
jgi:release factor glutamine methyltransferase